jgi:hypothetical protein
MKVGNIETTNEVEQTEIIQNRKFKIGDKIKSGDAVLTVLAIKRDWKSSVWWEKPASANDVYTVVTVTVENTGDKNLGLSWIWDFKLEDANGVQRRQSVWGGTGLNKFPTGELSPKGKATGDVLFEIDKNALANLKLHYKPIFSWNQEIVVELQ